MLVAVLLIVAAGLVVVSFLQPQDWYAVAALVCCAAALVLLAPAVLPALGRGEEREEEPAVTEDDAAEPDGEEPDGEEDGGDDLAATPPEATSQSDDAEPAEAADPPADQAEPDGPVEPVSGPVTPAETGSVLVVPGRHRFHRPGCALLSGRETHELTEDEALEEGFTACTKCALPAAG